MSKKKPQMTRASTLWSRRASVGGVDQEARAGRVAAGGAEAERGAGDEGRYLVVVVGGVPLDVAVGGHHGWRMMTRMTIQAI